MPIYTLRCTRCGLVADRIVSFRDYDVEQHCNAAPAAVPASPPTKSGATTSATMTATGATTGVPEAARCNGLLVRDGIEVTAKMRHQWMP